MDYLRKCIRMLRRLSEEDRCLAYYFIRGLWEGED